MGNSHFSSNVVAKTGSETITGFARVQAGSLVATDLNINKIIASSYVAVGTNKYIFSGTETAATTIVVKCVAVTGTPIKGSIYLGAGSLWAFVSDTVASPISTS